MSTAEFQTPAFAPPPLLGNGRLMTLVGALPRPNLAAFDRTASERIFEVGDGSRLLARCHWQPEPREAAAVVLLHGLTGSASSAYAISTARKLFARGFSVVRLNARNCGGTEELATTLYHAALVDDPLHVLRALIEAPGVPRLYLAGFSMGGNLALLLAATRADVLPPELAAIAAVSPPLDLAGCSRLCAATRFNRRLTRRFLLDFERMLARREALFPGSIDLDAFDRRMSLWDFDAAYTAPLAGYASVEDYYAAGSVAGRFEQIRLPGLVVHAEDDPLIRPEPFRSPELVDHPRLERVLTADGGHVAFVARAPAEGLLGRDEDRRWAENRLVDFLCHREGIWKSAGGAPQA
ncbi:MAG: alpha/beta fold hydrolase [Planctomycetota bacterium]